MSESPAPMIQLDRLECLDAADDPRQHAEHAAFGAARHESRRWRLGVEAAIAGAFLRVEHRRLSLEAEDAAVDIRLAEQHAGVVDEIARGEIVGAVHDDVVLADDVERVLRREPRLVGLHVHVGIEIGEASLGRLELRRAEGGGAVDDLPLEVGEVHHVEVDDPDGADARRGEIERQRRAQSAGADGEHARGLELALSLHADLGQQEVPRVPQNLGVGELRQLGLDRRVVPPRCSARSSARRLRSPAWRWTRVAGCRCR